MLLDKSRLNAERGLPPPLCALPLQFYTLPIALSTVWGLFRKTPEQTFFNLAKRLGTC